MEPQLSGLHLSRKFTYTDSRVGVEMYGYESEAPQHKNMYLRTHKTCLDCFNK